MGGVEFLILLSLCISRSLLIVVIFDLTPFENVSSLSSLLPLYLLLLKSFSPLELFYIFFYSKTSALL